PRTVVAVVAEERQDPVGSRLQLHAGGCCHLAHRAQCASRGGRQIDTVRRMLAVYAASIDPDDPLSGLVVGDRPEPEVPPGWTTVTVKAAALTPPALGSRGGVGLAAEQLPMILGCDAAGIDENGEEVLVHAVISSDSWRGDETLDPRRSLLSERHQGAL